MAVITPTKNSTQITNILALPIVYNKPNEREGRVRIAYFEYTPTVAVAAAAIIALTKLPYKARIIQGIVTSNALVATSTADVGLAAVDATGLIDATVGATVADNATYLTAGGTLAVATAGSYSFANTQANHYGYELQKECYLILTLNTAGMDGAGDSLQGHVLYVVD